MPIVRAVRPVLRRLLAGLVSLVVFGVVIERAVALPLPDAAGTSPSPVMETVGHLLVSEVMTGGASASDEFIELYNPTTEELPLEGLEVVYVTASGATVTRKASWSVGATGLPPGTHILIANAAGTFAGVADVAYANGLAATGGSVALRVIGAASAIDAVGWGNAASTWLETQPAPAPPAGSSLERLPGGSSGSGQDTDDNLIDWFEQPQPDPQNSGSPPVPGDESPAPSASASASPMATETPEPGGSSTPASSPTPTPTTTMTPSAVPTASPSPSPTATLQPEPSAISIAEARTQPDGAMVTVEGVALTAGDFADGGGYLADASAGIAVLVADGSFPRAALLRVTGTVDDRYAQRTIRTAAAAIVSLGTGTEPLPVDAATGDIGEGFEGRLVEVTGIVSSSATTLSTGVAWELDDGSGTTRVLVENATGIDTSGWARGVGLTVVGVVGQRDSSGTGTSGYRVQPRDAADVVAIVPAATPSPSPSPEPTAQPSASSSASPSADPSSPLVSISDAREAATGTRLRIRGVVTAPSGLIEVGSAVVQDATAAILVRIGTDVGSLELGQLVELDGTRATKAGMLSLRVSIAPLYLGSQPDPEPLRRATGALGEAVEARLVLARGAISGTISRPRGGNVSFALDDGSGSIRVTISSHSQIPVGSLTAGSWIELRAVLAQETTGSAPTSGYRLWPRMPADLQLLAAATTAVTTTGCCTPADSRDSKVAGHPKDSLQGVIAIPGERASAPVLTRPHPTSSPRHSLVALPGGTATLGYGAAAGGLVVSGVGLAALAGVAAWTGRRRPPDHDSQAEAATDAASSALGEDVPSPGHLSLVPAEPEDARNVRRILPPI